MNTIGGLLRHTTNAFLRITDTPRLDAEILLVHALGRDRTFLRAWPEKKLTDNEFTVASKLIDSRLAGTPVAYLTGAKEFSSRNFLITPSVLIPRTETELLVELALNLIPVDQPSYVIDLGTGSGIIGITLAAERPQASVVASDISTTALLVAKNNAQRHTINNISFVESNWFSAIQHNKFDIIVSNPPYVADNDPHLRQGDLPFEPEAALKSGPSGLDALNAIADGARKYLHPEGYLLLEHGYDQASPLAEMLDHLNYSNIEAHPDLQGHLRATLAQWVQSN